LGDRSATMQACRDVLQRWRLRLLRLPNVLGVGVGYKTVGGKGTDRPAIVVMVRKKVPAGTLQQAERVPPVIESVPTDVVEVGDLRPLSGTVPET